MLSLIPQHHALAQNFRNIRIIAKAPDVFPRVKDKLALKVISVIKYLEHRRQIFFTQRRDPKIVLDAFMIEIDY